MNERTKYKVRGGGGGAYSHIFPIWGRSDSQGIIFRVLRLKQGITISHFRVVNRVVPVNRLLFSPFDHIIFADFVRLRWNAWKRKLIEPFLVFWIRPAWSSLEQGKKLQHFLLDRVAKFTSFVLNRVRVSLSLPNPPTQIPVESTPRV